MNSAYTHSGVQYGTGKVSSLVSGLKKANDFAKENKVVTKASGVVTALGGDAFLDRKTGGLYTKGVTHAKSYGYGRKPKHKKKK